MRERQVEPVCRAGGALTSGEKSARRVPPRRRAVTARVPRPTRLPLNPASRLCTIARSAIARNVAGVAAAAVPPPAFALAAAATTIPTPGATGGLASMTGGGGDGRTARQSRQQGCAVCRLVRWPVCCPVCRLVRWPVCCPVCRLVRWP
eukprot:5784800-Pyramimonas_sp.AAC.1